MEAMGKLDTLVASAEFDVCGYSGPAIVARPTGSPLRFLYKAALPGGGSVCLFKVLLTNVCVNDCAYCANAAGRDCRRAAFRPEELAKLFVELHSKKLAQGLFLSSGIAGNASRTMEAMIQTVEIVRKRYAFKGYIHLKILPGASFGCVEEACKLATRVSVNMEAPTAPHMAKLSSRKDIHRDILERMRWVKQLVAANERLVPSGQTTQFVVGAAGEADRDLLSTTNALYRDIGLRRVYFSAFRPVIGSPLEGHHPTPPLREHRLYQADWLLREYRFPLNEVELALGNKDNLYLSKDPKLIIAQKQPWLFPLDVKAASYDELLRVPGIGPISARKIVAARQEHDVSSLDDLRKLGVPTKRATPYLWFPGLSQPEKQLSFFSQLEEEEHRQESSLAEVVG